MAEGRERKWYTINRKLAPVKAFYFLSLAAVGVLLPFISLYMKQIGLSSAVTGLMYGLMPFIGFFVKPIVGLIADRLHRHKLILAICCLLSGLFFFLLLYVPYSQSEYSSVRTNIHCGRNSYIHECYPVNHSGSRHCPLTFTAYVNVSTDTVKTETTLNDASFLNGNLTASYQHKDETLHHRSVQCSAFCHYKSGSSSRTKTCFANRVEDTTDCVGASVTLGYIPDWTFAIKNMSSITRRDVVQNESNGDLLCQDFDLNSVTYRGIDYRHMMCDSDIDLECELKCTTSKDKICTVMETQVTTATVPIFFVLFLFGNMFVSPIFSIADAVTYDILGERRNLYGKQRLWGTIGFVLCALTSSFIMYMLSENPMNTNFSVSFYVYIVLFLITTPCVYWMPLSADVTCSSDFKDVCKLFRHCKVVIFLVMVFFFGILNGVIGTFLYWYLSELDGYTAVIPGLCILVACTAETQVLALSGYIINRVGHLGCLYISLVAYLLRFVCYSLITNAWYVLPIELLHAITFGLMWPTATSYTSIVSPPGLSATVQGLVGGLHWGFGKGLGSIITGVLITALGFVWTFRLYGLVSLLLLIFYFITNRFFLKEHHNLVQKKSEQDDGSTPGNSSTAEVAQNLLQNKDKQKMEPLGHS